VLIRTYCFIPPQLHRMFAIRIFAPVLLVLSLVIFCNTAKATHAMGADLTYTCVGPNTYEIRLNFYRDCDGIAASPTTSVDISSVSCGLSYSLTLQPDTLFTGLDTFYFGDEVSPLCPANLPLSTCNGGPYPGVEVYSYSAIVTFPTSCPDWNIAYSLCCRNAAIDNLLDPDSEELYVEATMDNTGGLCNNSVFFTQLPVTYICNGEPFNFNHGAIDIDGDSLSYTLINPLTAGAVPISYAGGFSLTTPMAVTGTFGFDEASGQITFTPSAEQTGVLTVLVEEFRGGVLIGSTMRDIQIVVTNCPSNSAPAADGSFIGLDGGVALDANTIQSCPGDTIRFSLSYSDANIGDVLSASSTLALLLPGVSVSYSGINPLVVNVSWITSLSDTGFYAFTVAVQDDACPIFSNQIFNYDIDLLAGTFAGPDVTYCPGGIPAQLVVTGGSLFSWTPAFGLDDPLSQVPKATPGLTTDYIVTSNLSAFCKNTDTVRVTVVPAFNYLLSPGDTLCRFDETTIGVNTEPVWGPYSYSWFPVEGLSDPFAPVTDASPFATTYYQITMTSDTGCAILDSIPVVIQGAIPQLNAIADKTLICPGDASQFNLAPLCGVTPAPCGTLITGIAGSESLSTDGQTPFKGGYDDSRMQILYSPEALNEAGFFGGALSELGFFVSEKNSTTAYRNFTLKISCLDAGSLDGGFVGGTETVFGPLNYSTVSGWNNFVLSTPFSWGGDEGLLVEICFDNPDYGFTEDDKIYYSTADYNASVIDFNLLTTGCGLDESPAVSNKRPNMRVRFCSQDAGGIDITWAPITGLSDPSIQNPLASPTTGPITYVVTLDDNGCATSDTLTIDVDNSLILDAGNDVAICNDESVPLSALALGTPPAEGFAFVWSPALGLSNPFVANPVASPNSSTTYTVSTTSQNGCSQTDSVTVNVFVLAIQASPDTVICAGQTVSLQAGGGVLYEWSPAEGLSCTDCPEPLASPTMSTRYEVAVTDENGCTDSMATFVQVNPIPYVEAFADTTLFIGETAFLSASAGSSFTWTPTDGLSDHTGQFTAANPLQTTIYTLLLTDANGCQDTREVTVTVLELLEIYVPNAFSPNGDGQNDALLVIDRGLAGLDEFSIYNRWGEMLFTTANINDGWDGTYKGKDQEVGTYMAVVRARSLTGAVLQKNTAVQLVR